MLFSSPNHVGFASYRNTKGLPSKRTCIEVSSVHLTFSSSPSLSLIFEAATNSVLLCISSFLLFSESMADFISVLLLYYYI